MTDSYNTNVDGDDLDMKERFEENIPKESKKKRWISIGLAALMVTCILTAAIAIPVTLTQKKNSGEENLNGMDYPTVVAIATTTEIAGNNVTAASLPPKKKKKSKGLLETNKETRFHPPSYAHEISPYSNLIRLKTFTPPDKGRIFVMGDIHGCIDEMNALLKKIKYRPKKDVLILTGDLVFRGKDSVGVIRRARELNALCVRGNHDDKVVRLRGYLNKHGLDEMPDDHDFIPEGEVADPLRFNNKHSGIASEMSAADYTYLAGCPLILDIPELQARVVHGGLDPTVEELIDNDPWSVMNMRDMDDDNEPSKSKESVKDPSESDHIHWTDAFHSHSEAHNLNVTVYYGHDASRGIALGTKTIGVDSGCVYGRKLSAINIRTQELFQVDCEGA
ncbi:unnamed protein product [Mucor hiemalis]